jgi:3-deoxy-manno-octulosonate cytidylyltransferase (CMP-KDO synthetase)
MPRNVCGITPQLGSHEPSRRHPLPAGRDAPAGQAAGRYTRRADDRPRLAPRHGGGHRAGGGGGGGGPADRPPPAPEIAAAIERAGGTAILTDPDLPTGSDRVYEAVRRLDPARRHDIIVNVQGDLPTVEPAVVRAVLTPFAVAEVDIATLGCIIRVEDERYAPSVVKAVAPFAPDAGPGAIARALYFTRVTAPGGAGEHYHHIGLYAFRRAALERYVALPPGVLEQRERLEQLRALEAGMRIDVVLVDTVPLGIDTPADLARAREMLAP